MVDGCVNNKEDLQEIESNITGPIPSSSKPIIHITIVIDYNPNFHNVITKIIIK